MADKSVEDNDEDKVPTKPEFNLLGPLSEKIGMFYKNVVADRIKERLNSEPQEMKRLSKKEKVELKDKYGVFFEQLPLKRELENSSKKK